MKNGKVNWLLIILMMAGLVIGGLLGKLAGSVPILSWLSYGQNFGMTTPWTLDLGVISFTFGVSLYFSISGIIGLVLGIFLYNWIGRR